MRMFLEEPYHTRTGRPLKDDLAPAGDKQVIDALQQSVENLSGHFKGYPDLEVAVGTLLRLLHNVRLAPPGISSGDQLRAHNRMRLTLQVDLTKVPITSRLLPFWLAFVAHNEVIAIAFEFLDPWHVHDHLFVPKVLLIERIHGYLQQVQCTTIVRRDGIDAEVEVPGASLVEVPYRLAKNYKETGMVGCL